MRLISTVFILHLLFFSCQSGPTESEASTSEPSTSEAPIENETLAASASADFPMKPDTIEIRIKFLSGCDILGKVKIAEHNELHSPWKKVVGGGKDFSF